MSTQDLDFNQIDHMIAQIVLDDASITSTQLGARVGLSASAANERLRRLKQNGYVKKIKACVSAEWMDMPLCAFIFCTLEPGTDSGFFLEEIKDHPWILECHHMTGAYAYLLKVRCAHTKDLERFITDFLKAHCRMAQTHTHIVLSSYKDHSFIADAGLD